MENQLKEYLPIGKLGKSFGLDGHLRVIMQEGTDDIWSDIIAKKQAIFVGILDFKIPFFIQEYLEEKNLIKFNHIRTEDQFKELANKDVYVVLTEELRKSTLDPELFDNMTLIDAESQAVMGQIIRIEEFPAHPMAFVSTADGEVMVPLVEEWIIDMNSETKEVVMLLPEGLF